MRNSALWRLSGAQKKERFPRMPSGCPYNQTFLRYPASVAAAGQSVVFSAPRSRKRPSMPLPSPHDGTADADPFGDFEDTKPIRRTDGRSSPVGCAWKDDGHARSRHRERNNLAAREGARQSHADRLAQTPPTCESSDCLSALSSPI